MHADAPEDRPNARTGSSAYSRTVGPGEAGLWKKRAPLLTWLDIELTERCNFDCIHCYINRPAGDRKARAEELPAERVEAILAEATDLGCLKVRFTGGEPLLRKDFERMYLFARRRGLKVILFTNASLVTPRLADLLRRVPPLEPVEVSVYGMTRAATEKVTRVPGSHEAVRRGIDLLLERQVPFVVKGAFLEANKGDVEAFERWAAGIPWMKGAPGYSQLFNLRARRDSEARNRSIERLRLSAAESLGLLTKRAEDFDREMREFCSKFMAPGGRLLFTCGAGRARGCVDAYGRFSPCLLLKAPEVEFDLAEGSMKEALTGLFPKVRAMRAENPEFLARCARCFLRGLCGQCPARSWTESGTLDTPADYLCQAAHAKALYLGLLKKGEKAWEVRDWRGRAVRPKPASRRKGKGR